MSTTTEEELHATGHRMSGQFSPLRQTAATLRYVPRRQSTSQCLSRRARAGPCRPASCPSLHAPHYSEGHAASIPGVHSSSHQNVTETTSPVELSDEHALPGRRLHSQIVLIIFLIGATLNEAPKKGPCISRLCTFWTRRRETRSFKRLCRPYRGRENAVLRARRRDSAYRCLFLRALACLL